MSERRRIELPDELPTCGECGAECDFVRVADIREVEEGATITEVRCANGHLRLSFLKPSQEAIALGRKLAARYGR